MHLDVQELRNFYYRSHLGRAVQAAVQAQLYHLWSDLRGGTVVGYGFAAPLLRPALPHAQRVIALMPGAQGVMHWPPGLPNHSVLCEENRWPLPNESIDRLVLYHGLDASDTPAAVLEECYRTLHPQGRMVVIVPNRTSLWARRDGTPFSLSRPYSPHQIERQLKWHGFLPREHITALYQPPSQKRFWRQMGPLMEKVGQAIPAWRGGGVLMVEVEKQTPRPKRPGLGQIISRPMSVLEGIALPEGRPARSPLS